MRNTFLDQFISSRTKPKPIKEGKWGQTSYVTAVFLWVTLFTGIHWSLFQSETSVMLLPAVYSERKAGCAPRGYDSPFFGRPVSIWPDLLCATCCYYCHYADTIEENPSAAQKLLPSQQRLVCWEQCGHAGSTEGETSLKFTLLCLGGFLLLCHVCQVLFSQKAAVHCPL